MDHIGAQLQRIEQNMRINSSDPIAQHGFTQLPNFILRNADISANAKVVYSLPTVKGFRNIGRAAMSTLLRETAPAITQSGTCNSDGITNATADFHAMKP